MKNKRLEIERWAYKFTKPTIMKFQPVQDFEQPTQQETTSIFTRIKTFFSPPSKQKIKSPIKRMNSIAPQHRPQVKKTNFSKPVLKYVKRLTNEHVLIGNQDQLDAMSISGIIHEFVDTQFLWSINLKRAILNMVIDYKKNYIILLPQKQILIYSFDPKFIRNKPIIIGSLKLQRQVRFIQVIKQSIFIVCYSTGIQVYSIDQIKGIRITLKKSFEIPKDITLNLLQIPTPYQNVLNIFFQEQQDQSTCLVLWNIQIQFSEKEVKIGKACKVYDVPGFLKKFIRLQNYSKDIYLINLGREIHAVRKGYIIDSANINIGAENNYLKYISHQKLMHISQTKAEVYQFKVDISMNPPRITLNSTDSIEIPSLPRSFEYVESVQILGDNFAIFYQTKIEENKLLHGQLKYGFLVSHLVKMEDKIKEILPQQIASVSIDTIAEKADMANKMGLQRKDIYLRLWQNSQKSQVQDYKILLDTLDYQTIKQEVQNKLKKASMNLRQMILLEQGCLSMLHQSVYGPTPSREDIKNYLISHLLIKKLQLYRLISLIQKRQGKAVTEDEQGKLLINIQNYNYYKTVDIKSLLHELIGIQCNQQKNVIMKIRTVLSHFKFSLRINYQSILQQIIIKTKKKFLIILEAIPQLLPYDNKTIILDGFQQSLWDPINNQQWQKQLYNESLLTIDNKQIVADVCSNVWFKRYWLSQHQYVNLSKNQIQQIHHNNCSDIIFYNVIQKIFDNVKQYLSVRSLIDFMQDKYQKLPQHLYGKIFLYRKLFQQFKQHQKINKIQGTTQYFRQFLKLRDQDIFKVMFNFQKIKKNFILKQMKPLYLKLASNQIFNQGLLSYFASSKSQTSDIKYLLNRMNNQKRQFHQENQGIYQVLVRGMQLKLKLGSNQDVPIDQVLIYIQNIPLSHDNPVMRDLQTMRLINQESNRFRKVSLNMSIFEMMKNVDNVIAALVEHSITQTGLLQSQSYAQVKDISHRIISDMQQLKNKIFPQGEPPQLILFTFLVKLMSQHKLLPFAALLLKDDWLTSNFTINEIFIENLILYMYKWKLNQFPSYSQSNSYLCDLISILPPNNQVRQYIQCEIDFSNMLSAPEQHIYYPLSNGQQYFTAIQLESILSNIPASHLLSVNVDQLTKCALRIQEISSDGALSAIRLQDVYEMVILRLVQCGFLRESVKPIRRLLELQKQSLFNYIYPSLLVAKIAPELIDQNRNLLLKCSSFLFHRPIELLEILEKLMHLRGTNAEYRAVLQKWYEVSKANGISYSQDSPILQELLLGKVQSAEDKRNFVTLLRHTLVNVLLYKQQFCRKVEFYIMFVILCNDPYSLAKYVYCNKYTINLKDFRCFLSFLGKEQVINRHNLLEFSKRMFIILYETISKNRSIETVIQQFRAIPISTTYQIDRIKNTKNEFQAKIAKSIDKLRSKIKAANAEAQRKKARGQFQNEEIRVKKFLQKLMAPKQKQLPIQDYPFGDSDDSPKNQEGLLKKEERKLVNIEGFDAKFERYSMMRRKNKEIGPYVSTQKQRQQRSMYYTQKFVRDGIFGSLNIDKKVQNVLEVAINNAFRQSVKRSHSHRKLRIGKVAAQEVDVNTLNLSEQIERISNRRSQAVSNIGEQDLNEIKRQEETLIKEERVPEVGNIIAQAIIINQILKQNDQINEKTVFNFNLLEPYKNHPEFSNFLQEIVRLVYEKNLPFKSALLFIKKLSEKYHQLQINKQWLQVYLRAEHLQNKFNLEIPLRNMLKIEGLFTQSEIPERLFNFLLPSIVAHCNDQNVMKVCKVVTLAFRKPQMEQEILFRYVLGLFEHYARSIYQPTLQEKDFKMQKEKIYLILNKIPVKMLLGREDELMRGLGEESVRAQIVSLIATSFRRRYDQKAAEYVELKWIAKRKDGQLQK